MFLVNWPVGHQRVFECQRHQYITLQFLKRIQLMSPNEIEMAFIECAFFYRKKKLDILIAIKIFIVLNINL